VYESPSVELLYFEDPGELYVNHPAGVVLRCRPAAGEIRMSVDPDNAAGVALATHPLLNAALIEVLKARGRYNLHAACASLHGRGVVVVGPSGAGKSTLAIALARAGMDFLADDMVFLGERAGALAGEWVGGRVGDRSGAIEVLGFPDEVDVTEQTLAMYPELEAAARELSSNGRQKRSLRLEEAVAVTEALRCSPAAILFARVAHRDRSQLLPISPTDALVALAPNVLLTDPAAAQAHLAILASLVRTTPCWRLETGRDLADVSGVLGRLAA
jgi:hypothetical protein